MFGKLFGFAVDNNMFGLRSIAGAVQKHKKPKFCRAFFKCG